MTETTTFGFDQRLAALTGSAVEAHTTDGGRTGDRKLSLQVTLPDGTATRKYVVGGYHYYVVNFGLEDRGDGKHRAYVYVAKRTGDRATALRAFNRASNRYSGTLLLERRGGTYRVAKSTVTLAEEATA